MFEMMNAEIIKSEMKAFGGSSESESCGSNPVQLKPSLVDRALISLGQVMITTGLKLKYRQLARLSNAEAHTPNFLIML